MTRNAFVFNLAAHHEAGDVLEKDQGNLALTTQLDEVRTFDGRFGKQDAIVGDDAHGHAFNAGKAGDQGAAKAGFEFIKVTVVYDAGNDLPHVVGLARVGRDDAVEFFGGIARRHPGRCLTRQGHGFLVVKAPHGLPRQGQGMQIVLGQMIGHPGKPGVHISAAQVFGRDDLAGGGFDQRRAAQKDGPLVFDDDGLIAHGRHISAAGGATTHDHRQLRDALGAEVGLVEKDPAKVLAIRKNLVLIGQVGPA